MSKPKEEMKAMSSDYAKNAVTQNEIAMKVKEEIEKLVLPFLQVEKSETPFTLLELGSGPGNSSYSIIACIIRRVIAEVQQKQVMVYCEDLPGNRWNSVFELLPSLLDEISTSKDKIFLCGIGRSFYGPLLPSNSVDFVYSNTALHWLPSDGFYEASKMTNRRIMTVSNHIEPQEHQKLTKFAQHQWHTIFLERAREMKSGSFFAMSFPLDPTYSTIDYDSKFSEFGDMMTASFPFSLVPADLHDVLCAPCWMISEEVLRIFFSEKCSGDSENLSKLYELVSSRRLQPPCSFTKQYMDDSDVVRFASDLWEASHTVIEPFVRSVLQSALEPQQIESIINIWKETWLKDVQALPDPTVIHWAWPSNIIILRRR